MFKQLPDVPVLSVWAPHLEKLGARAAVSVLNRQQNDLQGRLNNRVWGFTPRVCDSVGLKWGPRICISNNFSGGTETAGLGATLRGTWS